MYSFFISSCSVVTLLDYGAGNVRSVRNAIRFLGFDIKDVSFFFFFSFLVSTKKLREDVNGEHQISER